MTHKTYRIAVSGHLGHQFTDGFAGMSLYRQGSQSILYGDIVDQSHLHGLLDQLRRLGIEVVSFATITGDDHET